MNKQILQDTIKEWHSKTPKSVHSVGYGHKTTNGITTDELCVVFSVISKKPLAELTQEEILPTSLIIDNETIKTDVVEGGMAHFSNDNRWRVHCSPTPQDCTSGENSTSRAHREKHRPLVGGISIGHNEAGAAPNAGTLGAMFEDLDDTSIVGLTNLHIVCNDIDGATWSDDNRTLAWDIRNKSILQPGTLDGGIAADSIGNIKRYYPLVTNYYGEYNYIDAAVIGIDNVRPSLVKQSFSADLLGTKCALVPVMDRRELSGAEIASTLQIDRLLANRNILLKSGKSTGYVESRGCNEGLIRVINNSLCLDIGNYSFCDTIAFAFDATALPSTGGSTTHRLKNVCLSGDSGSLLLAKFTNRGADPDPNPDAGVSVLDSFYVVGLIFATGSTHPEFPNNIGYACRIDRVMEMLNLRNLRTYPSPLTYTIKSKNEWVFLERDKQAESSRDASIMITGAINDASGGDGEQKYWECGQTSDDKTVYVRYGGKITPPLNVVGEPGANQCVVRWEAPVYNGGYPIQRYEVECIDTTYEPANPTPQTSLGWLPKGSSPEIIGPTTFSYTVTGLKNGHKYRFRVRAFNSHGQRAEANLSEETTPVTVPYPPQFIKLVAGNSQLSVTWEDYKYKEQNTYLRFMNGGADITDYLVEYSSNYVLDSQSTTWTTFFRAPSVERSCIITGLINGTKYMVRVSAKNRIGTSLFQYNTHGVNRSMSSMPVAPIGLPILPDSPTNVYAILPSSVGFHEIIHGNRIDGLVSRVIWTEPLKKGVILEGLPNGSLITHYMVEYSEVGSNKWLTIKRPVCGNSNYVIDSLTRQIVYYPLASKEYTCFMNQKEMTGISNPEPTHIPREPTSGYMYGERNYINIVLSVGKSYVFRVSSKNSVGLSAPSANSEPFIPSRQPLPPSGVVAVSGNSQLSVTWQHVVSSYDRPPFNGGSDITNHRVEYATVTGSGNSTTTGPWIRFGNDFSTPITSTSCTITGLSNGTRYKVRVLAINARGQGSFSSESLPVTVGATVPSEPRSVTAVILYGDIIVTWTAPLTNGGSAILHYLVKASSDGGRNYKTISSRVVNSTRTRLDTSTIGPIMIRNKNYVFKVIAKNEIGISLPSNMSASVYLP